jgi:WD40 repeat protein
MSAGVAEMNEIGRIAVPAGLEVGTVMVSPNGQQLTAACSDHKLRVWSLLPGPSSAILHTVGVDVEPISAIAYSGDGNLMAAGTRKGAVAVFRARTGEVVVRFQTADKARPGIRALAIAPDGSRLAVATAIAPAELWDVASARRRASLITRFGCSWALDFSPDGTRLVSADADTAIRIYDAEGRLRVTNHDCLLEPFAVAFTADGKQVVTGGADKTVTLMDEATGNVVRQFPKQEDSIQWLAPLSKGRTVVSGSFKDASMRIAGATLAWSLDAAAPRVISRGRQFNGRGAVNDGRLLLTSMHDGTLVVEAMRQV